MAPFEPQLSFFSLAAMPSPMLHRQTPSTHTALPLYVSALQAGTDAVRITVLEMKASANKFTGLITVSPATARVSSAPVLPCCVMCLASVRTLS